MKTIYESKYRSTNTSFTLEQNLNKPQNVNHLSPHFPPPFDMSTKLWTACVTAANRNLVENGKRDETKTKKLKYITNEVCTKTKMLTT